MTELWRRCVERLEGEFSAEELHTYLKPLQAVEDDSGLRLLAPNAYTREHVESALLPRIRAVLQHLAGRVRTAPPSCSTPQSARATPAARCWPRTAG